MSDKSFRWANGALIVVVLLGLIFSVQLVSASYVIDDKEAHPPRQEAQRAHEQDVCPEIPPLGVEVMMCWEVPPGNSKSYFLITIKWDSDGDGDIDCMKTYPGWCADSGIYMDDDHCFPVTLYSSLDPALPVMAPYACDDERWHYINYIFNQWTAGDPFYQGVGWREIQQVVWMFADENYSPNDVVPPIGWRFRVWEIYNHALNDYPEHGASFIPNVGEAIALICDYGDEDGDGLNDKQLVFFTVPRTPSIPIPELPFGTIAAIAASLIALTAIRTRKRNEVPL